MREKASEGDTEEGERDKEERWERTRGIKRTGRK